MSAIAIERREIVHAREDMQEKMDEHVNKMMSQKEFDEAERLITSMDYHGYETNHLRVKLGKAITSEMDEMEQIIKA